MAPNITQFTKEIDDFYTDLLEEWKEEIYNDVRAFQTEIVRRTPKKTGRAKSGWAVSVGGPNYDHYKRGILDSDAKTWISESEALMHARKSLSSLQNSEGFPDIYVSNGVENEDKYIVKLEHGTSSQAPPGFMASGTVQWSADMLGWVITGSIEGL